MWPKARPSCASAEARCGAEGVWAGWGVGFVRGRTVARGGLRAECGWAATTHVAQREVAARVGAVAREHARKVRFLRVEIKVPLVLVGAKVQPQRVLQQRHIRLVDGLPAVARVLCVHGAARKQGGVQRQEGRRRHLRPLARRRLAQQRRRLAAPRQRLRRRGVCVRRVVHHARGFIGRDNVAHRPVARAVLAPAARGPPGRRRPRRVRARHQALPQGAGGV